MLQSPIPIRPSFRWKPFVGRKNQSAAVSLPGSNAPFHEVVPSALDISTASAETAMTRSGSDYYQPSLSPTATCDLTPDSEALGDAIMMRNFPPLIEPFSLEEEAEVPQKDNKDFSPTSSCDLASEENALTNTSNLCPTNLPTTRTTGCVSRQWNTCCRYLPSPNRRAPTINPRPGHIPQLLAETLEFDFVYFMSIEISEPMHPICCYSSHNPPIPMPTSILISTFELFKQFPLSSFTEIHRTWQYPPDHMELVCSGQGGGFRKERIYFRGIQ